jgi:L-fuculose-phosphate aldolase
MAMNDIRENVLWAANRLCQDRLVVGTWGNISARDGNCFWITPSGMPYESLTVSDLICLDLESGKPRGRWKPSSEWRLHMAFYRHRPDVMAVVHTHSIYATAFAVARRPVPAAVEDLAQAVGGSVEVAPYALPGTDELAKNAVQAFGKKNAVLLANHGLVAAAKTMEEALKICLLVEKTAKIVLLAHSLGSVSLLSREDIEKMRHFYLWSYGPEKDGEEKA